MADRHEKFERTRPDGVVVVIDRNIDTGTQEVSVKDSEPNASAKKANAPSK